MASAIVLIPISSTSHQGIRDASMGLPNLWSRPGQYTRERHRFRFTFWGLGSE